MAKNIFLLILFSLLVTNCGQKGSQNTSGPGVLALKFTQETAFDPNISQSQIDYFVVTITGDDLENPIKRKFGYDTGNVTFDDFEIGTSINITVEAVNLNGYTIKRGTVEGVEITDGDTTIAEIVVRAVPIFANVYHNATVYSRRFVPQIFAPANVSFEVDSNLDGTETVLQDLISGEVSFSMSDSDENSVRTIHSAPLTTGSHQLTVRDVNNGEATTILLNVVDTGTVRAMPTTAGAYVGSFMSADPYRQTTNLFNYFENAVQ